MGQGVGEGEPGHKSRDNLMSSSAMIASASASNDPWIISWKSCPESEIDSALVKSTRQSNENTK